MNINERIEKTEKDIKDVFEKSIQVMLKKNRQRGDCWRSSGLQGQFVEIHSMYNRLRNLIWEIGNKMDNKDWKDQVANALEDLRNFTMLAELCLDENNFKGDGFHNDKL